MKLENIDTSTTEGKIEVMQAYAAGRKLMYKDRRFNTWTACSVPLWNWAEADYAVIKEPRELYLIEVVLRGYAARLEFFKFSKEDAEYFAKEQADKGHEVTITKFIEA